MISKSDRRATDIQSDVRESLEQEERLLLGPRASYEINHDPRHFVFMVSRYKFVSKMLAGYGSAIEVGCGDGFGTNFVAQTVPKVLGVDIEPYTIENVADTAMRERVEFALHNFVQHPLPGHMGKYDAAYSIDVIEHLEPRDEEAFIRNVIASLNPNGVFLVGTPNESSAQYASANANAQHINLKTFEGWRETMLKYFGHVFMFGMNDEVLHTGFGPMCHYVFALGVSPRS